MNCPKCGNDVVSCIDSRPKSGTIYRRRKCISCGFRFSTVEIGLDDLESYKQKEAFLADMLSRAGDIQAKLKERETK